MNNVVQRLLLFFIGIPGFILLVLFVPWADNLVTVFIAAGIIVACSIETSRMLKTSGFPSDFWPVFASGILPFLVWSGCALSGLESNFFPGKDSFSAGVETLLFGFSFTVCVVLTPLAFFNSGKLPLVAKIAAARLMVLLYPGILGSMWILITSGFERGTEAILTFALMTFGNDSLAWLTGVTLGKKRGIVAASPNKSIAGFIGGLSGSILAAFLSSILFPLSVPFSPLLLVFWGLLTGISVIIGDLFESSLKRSVGMKDSGSIVPGRGGFLDSFDSLLFASPAFIAIARIAGFF